MGRVRSFSLRIFLLLSSNVVITFIHLDQDFKGVVDLLTLNKLVWTEESKGREELHESELKECSDGALWEKAVQHREKLIDKLSNFDDKLAEDIILQESLERISASGLSAALRRATILCVCVSLQCHALFSLAFISNAPKWRVP